MGLMLVLIRQSILHNQRTIAYAVLIRSVENLESEVFAMW